ncbi:MAG: tRNA (adenine-N1)-methyltransferase [Nanoarchaeota archaeon]
MKVLLSLKTGRTYYYNENGDYHCKEGSFTEKELKSENNRLTSNKGTEFLISDSNLYDKAQKIKRGPQILITKDLGYILARAGIDKNSTILEAGGGSGAATCFFARFVKKVLTYEIRKDHCDIIEKNINNFGLKNVKLINKNLADDIEKLSADFVFLDMPEPIEVLEKKLSKIASGSLICCYLPSITQISNLIQFINENKKDELYTEEISEIIHREWKINSRVARPNHQKETDHTAFLVFLRKI